MRYSASTCTPRDLGAICFHKELEVQREARTGLQVQRERGLFVGKGIAGTRKMSWGSRRAPFSTAAWPRTASAGPRALPVLPSSSSGNPFAKGCVRLSGHAKVPCLVRIAETSTLWGPYRKEGAVHMPIAAFPPSNVREYSRIL
jgi:hypothetical protein